MHRKLTFKLIFWGFSPWLAGTSGFAWAGCEAKTKALMQIFFAVYQINITTICTNTFILWKVELKGKYSFILLIFKLNFPSLIVGGCSGFIRVQGGARDEIIFMISCGLTPEGCYHRNCELKKPINYLEGKSRSGCQPGYWNNFPMNTNSLRVSLSVHSTWWTSAGGHWTSFVCLAERDQS